ncbi:hypothetical protein UYSO10_1337 [Kosakonia radicincitans]|nr:hypothetical protein UYSO10_1337 [Kosakonia radicincitans]
MNTSMYALTRSGRAFLMFAVAFLASAIGYRHNTGGARCLNRF